MITKVYDQRGRLIHDCTDTGCAVSWDGYIINPLLYDQLQTPVGNPLPSVPASQAGTAVQGRSDPDPNHWDTSGKNSAKLKQ